MKNIIQSFVFLIVFLFGLNSNLLAQAYTWGTSFGGMYTDNITGMVTDASGNVYITGTYNGTITVGTTTINSLGLLDMYIAKYSSAGALVWLRAIGGSNNDYANDIAVDGAGNVTIVGSFESSVDFNPSATATYMVSTALFNIRDGFVLRLNSAGNFVWAKTFASDTYCSASSVALDAAGNIYVVGDFYGQIDANPSAANVMLNAVGQNDGFLIKLNSVGTYLWNKTYTTGIADEATEVAVDALSNVIVAGKMSYVPFIVKYSGVGVVSWSKNLEGGAGLFVDDIAIDSWGNIFMGGSYSDSLDIDLGSGKNMWYDAGTGDYNMFILKLNASGNTLWGQQTLSYFGGGTNDEYLDALAVDAAGSVYATGTTEGSGCMPVNTTVFNNLSPQVKSVFGGQNRNLFVVKYGKDGSYGSGFEWYFPVLDAIGKISVDGSGNIYTTGTFYSYAILNPATTNTVYSAGSDDCFITKFAPPCAFADAGNNMYLCPNVQGAAPASTGSVKLGMESVGGMLYEWSPNNNLSNAYIAEPLAFPTTTTTYNLTVTNALTGCFSTSAVTVTPPVESIAANQLGVDKMGCLNSYIIVGSPIANINNFQIMYSSSNSNDVSFTTSGMFDGYLETHSTISGTYQIYTEITETTTGCVVRDTVNVTFQNPTPNAGADIMMCQGTSVNIGTNPVAGYSYNWITYYLSPTQGLILNASLLNNNNISNPSFSNVYGNAGYMFILAATNSMGCVGYDTMMISVLPSNTANAGVDKTKCGTTGVTIGTLPPSPFYGMIQWTPATGLSATNIEQPIASPTANTTYILTKTFSYNNVTCVSKDTVLVKVGTIPTANAGADQSICKGAAVTIGGTSSVGMNYSWSPNVAGTATTAVSPTATTNYTLTVTNPATGCKKSDDVRVTVKSLPIVNAGSDATLCAGINTLIGSNAITGQTYAWTPSTGLSSATTAKPTTTPIATTMYIVTATKNACIKKDTVVVTVNTLPTANAGVDKSICNGTSATIGAANNAAYIYEWTPATNLSNAFISNPVATPTAAATTYTVNVTNATTGCMKTDAVVVTINAKPVANAGVDKNLTNCTAVTIGTAAVTGVSYSWTPVTGLSSTNISNPTASPAGMAVNATRTYTVTASKVYGTLTCSSTDAMLFKAMVACPSAPDQIIDNGQTGIGNQNGVNVVNDEMVVNIYPNPFSDEINISSDVAVAGNYRVVIVNTLGQVVYNDAFVVKDGVLDSKIDMFKYSAGVYFLTLESEVGSVVRKLVKE